MVKIKFREIDLFDFTSFCGLDFFKISGPLWNILKYFKINMYKTNLFENYSKHKDNNKNNGKNPS